MHKTGKNKILVYGAFALSIVFFGCKKPVIYPPEPSIEFKSFTQLSDSALVTFKFTDGDGDIGSNENEVADNVFLTYYEKVNGVWQHGLDMDGNPVVFTYATRNLTPTGKNKAIKGTIKVYVVPIFYNPGSPDSDTVRFDIQLVDRAFHYSNVVQTDELVRH